MNRIRLVAVTLAGLAVTCVGVAIAAPAAFARTVMIPADGGSAGSGVPTVTRTVVVGGMPGWQIALIAIAAALLAGSLAVLADRARAAHRKPALSAA